MNHSSTFKNTFCFCLLLMFILTGCSEDDNSTKAAAVEKKPEVEKVVIEKRDKGERRATPNRKTSPVKVPTGFMEDYTVAKQALGDQDYASAINYLKKAIEGRYDEELVLTIEGKRYGSYLPHYFLGTSFYLVGDCQSALSQWNISLSQQAIQKSQNYDYLKKSMEACKSGN